jgi:hypothetical protein
MATIARNIGSPGRHKRLRLGIAMVAVAVVAGVLLVAFGGPRGARLALFLPFYMGALGLLQARDHT